MVSRAVNKLNVTLQAGEEVTTTQRGQFLYCYNSGGAEFEVSIDNSGTFIPFAGGVEHREDGVDEFKAFTVKNTLGVPITLKMIYGYGSYKDNRASISGTLPVINGAGTTLEVEDADAHTALALVATKLDDLIAKDQNIDLTGCTRYANATVGLTTVITAAANTGGFIIETGVCHSYSHLHASNIDLDGVGIFPIVTNRNLWIEQPVKKLIIPAGVKVELYCAGTLNTAIIYGRAL